MVGQDNLKPRFAIESSFISIDPLLSPSLGGCEKDWGTLPNTPAGGILHLYTVKNG